MKNGATELAAAMAELRPTDKVAREIMDLAGHIGAVAEYVGPGERHKLILCVEAYCRGLREPTRPEDRPWDGTEEEVIAGCTALAEAVAGSAAPGRRIPFIWWLMHYLPIDRRLRDRRGAPHPGATLEITSHVETGRYRASIEPGKPPRVLRVGDVEGAPAGPR